jgi:4-hydroxybenzoyl-CoA thioesterase/acyl-CoA thioester hydrolase
MEPFRTQRRVEFVDTDAAGIAHFTALIAYMEQAEHEFLRHLGLSVVIREPTGEISWPRVSVQAAFAAAVRFEDQVEIEVRVDRLGEKSVTYGFQLNHGGVPVASGSITAVCCRIVAGRSPESMVIPQWIRDRFAPWLAPSRS